MTDAANTLLSSLDGGILTLTLNRPERLNAMDIALFERVLAACADAATDSAVRVLVLRGTGKAFSAGGDLLGAIPSAESSFEERVDGLRRRSNIAFLLHRMPKPTIAMLRGPVAGAAFAFALGCDIRIASETTKFVPAYARAGYAGDYGVSYLLQRLVGPAKAHEILFLGDPIDVAKANNLGIINQVTADDELEAVTQALAERLAAGPTLAYRYMKQNLALAETASFEQSLDIEAANMIRSMFSEDGKEAVQAFKEKRTPKFSGR